MHKIIRCTFASIDESDFAATRLKAKNRTIQQISVFIKSKQMAKKTGVTSNIAPISSVGVTNMVNSGVGLLPLSIISGGLTMKNENFYQPHESQQVVMKIVCSAQSSKEIQSQLVNLGAHNISSTS
ncbi:MAG: hypothetical protein RSB96_00240 [Oscillospiraceae bacterium]